jgi:hypothetical protein
MKSEIRSEKRREQYDDPFENYQRRQTSNSNNPLTNQMLMLNLLNSKSNALDNAVIINGSVYPIFKIGNVEFININGRDTILMSAGQHKFIELNGYMIVVK